MSDPENRLRVDSRPRAVAVSAAAKVRRIILKKSSPDDEKLEEYKAARAKDVASSLRIVIKIWKRCLAAAVKVIIMENRIID